MDDLTEKVCLVTGASTGVGAAVARALGAHGASVAVRSAFATCRAAIPRFRRQGSGAIINTRSAPDECVGAFRFLASERLSC